MSNKKWGNYTQEFDFAPDVEEIKNVQALLDRPYSCTDFSRLLEVQYEDLECAPEKYAQVFAPETVLRMTGCLLGAAPEWLREVVALGRAGRLVALDDKLRICGEGESNG